MADVLTIISNVAFLLPACEAAYKGKWTRFSIYILIVVASSMYHTCNSYPGSCALPSETLRHLDFFFAQLLIPLTALYVIHFSARWAFLERIFIVAFAFGIFLVQMLIGESIYIQMIVASISFAIIVAYWTGYGIVYARLPYYNWDWLIMGLGFTAVACSLFVTQLQYHLLYAYTHSCWHTIAALGQYYLLLSCKTDPTAKFKSLDAHAETTTGLVLPKVYSGHNVIVHRTPLILPTGNKYFDLFF